jgi:hypothetical protein
VKIRPLQFLTALSLLLCVAAGALLCATFLVHDRAVWNSHGEYAVAVELSHGAVVYRRWAPAEGGPVTDWAAAQRALPAARWWGRPSCGFTTGYDLHSYGRQRYWTVGLPMWVPLVAGLVLPVRQARRYRASLRARRVALGLCRRCGYDLRATPERRPECGMMPGTTSTP